MNCFEKREGRCEKWRTVIGRNVRVGKVFWRTVSNKVWGSFLFECETLRGNDSI